MPETKRKRLISYIAILPFVFTAFVIISLLTKNKNDSLACSTNDFGRQHSHGCVNLPTSATEQLFYWTSAKSVNSENRGTRIVIHE